MTGGTEELWCISTMVAPLRARFSFFTGAAKAPRPMHSPKEYPLRHVARLSGPCMPDLTEGRGDIASWCQPTGSFRSWRRPWRHSSLNASTFDDATLGCVIRCLQPFSMATHGCGRSETSSLGLSTRSCRYKPTMSASNPTEWQRTASVSLPDETQMNGHAVSVYHPAFTVAFERVRRRYWLLGPMSFIITN